MCPFGGVNSSRRQGNGFRQTSASAVRTGLHRPRGMNAGFRLLVSWKATLTTATQSALTVAQFGSSCCLLSKINPGFESRCLPILSETKTDIILLAASMRGSTFLHTRHRRSLDEIHLGMAKNINTSSAEEVAAITAMKNIHRMLASVPRDQYLGPNLRDQFSLESDMDQSALTIAHWSILCSERRAFLEEEEEEGRNCPLSD